MNEFSHIDESGKARMVDVGHKNEQLRIADFLDTDTDTRQRYQAFALEKKLHRQKTALMQDLLTGKVRVTPLLEAEAR